MHKLILLLLLIASTYFIQPTQKGQVLVAQNKEVSESVNPKQLDERARILSAYFAKYNSPLQFHAQDFIDAADTYQMDWKLVPAIAGVESGFGKRIPGGHGPQISYNAWGWGVYGNNSLGFKSWRHGIFTVSGGLKTRYIDRGLTDPYSMNKVYAASPTWGAKVTHFLLDLEKFTEAEKAQKQYEVDASIKEAGSSAQIAFN